MKKKLILYGTLVLALTITGCQKEDMKNVENGNEPAITETINKENEKKSEIIQEDGLIKIKSNLIDFSKVEYQSSETERDEKLEKTIIDYLEYNKDEDGKLIYYYNNIDLNGDEKEEIFVYLMGQYVSGTGGSTSLIIDQENYEVISNFTLVQNPIIISSETTNGWNDIIMQVYGGGAEYSFVKIAFDGESYPSNPSIAPKLEEKEVIEGVAIISNPVSIEDGLEIK